MTEQASRVFEQAMALAPEQRVELAERLWSSVDAASRAEIDEFWVREAQARLDAYLRGEVEAIPAREALDELRKKHQQ